jgi:hypothetical protein
MTPDQERWAEALAIDRAHGLMAPAVIGERIRSLLLAGDQAGVARWREIAARYDQLRGGTVQ